MTAFCLAVNPPAHRSSCLPSSRSDRTRQSSPVLSDYTKRYRYKYEKSDTLTLAAREPGNPDFPAGFDAPNIRQFVLKRK